MAKEKQKPYEFLSNLVLALMDTDSAFINAFFMDEFPDKKCSSDKEKENKTMTRTMKIEGMMCGHFGGNKTGRGYVYLSVCTSDPVYDEVSSFNDSAGCVAERIKNCTIFQL